MNRILLVILGLLLAAGAQAGNAEAKGALLHFGADRLAKAQRYLEAKDYPQARQWFQRAADAGDAEAMTKLGALYVNDKKEAQARGWFQKAAEAGNAEAMTELGVLYQFGQGGVARDYAQARRWYQKAADGGSPQGMFDLGYLYEQGLGVAGDYAQARRWYQKAADAGNAQAKEALPRLPFK